MERILCFGFLLFCGTAALTNAMLATLCCSSPCNSSAWRAHAAGAKRRSRSTDLCISTRGYGSLAEASARALRVTCLLGRATSASRSACGGDSWGAQTRPAPTARAGQGGRGRPRRPAFGRPEEEKSPQSERIRLESWNCLGPKQFLRTSVLHERILFKFEKKSESESIRSTTPVF